MCSLLYRNGMDDLDSLVHFPKKFEQQIEKNPQPEENSCIAQKKLSSIRNLGEVESNDMDIDIVNATKSNEESCNTDPICLSKEEARDLSKTYYELQRLHYQNQKEGERSGEHSSEWFFNENKGNSPSSQSQPHILLYKHLLRQLFYNEHDKVVKHMNFPSQTIENDSDACTMGLRMKQITKREFRTDTIHYAGEKFTINSKTKQETGFLVLRELQKKLSWAESVGISNLFQWPSTTQQTAHQQNKFEEDEKLYSRNAAKDVHVLPCDPPSTYLQPGTFLIAHPMMDGIFSRSVICVLQHTRKGRRGSVTTTGEGSTKVSHCFQSDNDASNESIAESNEDGQDEHLLGDDDKTEIFERHDGGTYGLIVNLPITVGVPNPHSTTKRRYRTLREVIRHDSLPEGVKKAFGDCPVQNGGPVNLSLQMLRVTSHEEEEKFNIGGTVLPTVINKSLELCGKVKSTAIYTDKAVYFGGDIIRAAQAVIDGDIDKGKHLTFLIC